MQVQRSSPPTLEVHSPSELLSSSTPPKPKRTSTPKNSSREASPPPTVKTKPPVPPKPQALTTQNPPKGKVPQLAEDFTQKAQNHLSPQKSTPKAPEEVITTGHVKTIRALWESKLVTGDPSKTNSPRRPSHKTSSNERT